MAYIDIKNISDLDINGNSLFDDSESFITELDDHGESIIGGYNRACSISNINCNNTINGGTFGTMDGKLAKMPNRLNGNFLVKITIKD